MLVLFLCLGSGCLGQEEKEYPSLPIGAAAPAFNLKGVDGKYYSLASFQSADILVLIFTCNHCPTAQAYEHRIVQLAADYSDGRVALAAIMPNDPRSVSLGEMGYTDIGDGYEDMQVRAKEQGFHFPYLYDGDSEVVARAYGPVATPHVFIFDRERKLRYRGRIDDQENQRKVPTSSDTRNAIEALLANRPVPVTTTKVFGCSIKWSDKQYWVKKELEEWAAEPVSLDTVNDQELAKLLKNNSGKLRLINVWATWCGPCISEFPDLVSINRMYRKRDFEFISISADDPGKKEAALHFLQKQGASNTNYLFSGTDKYKMIDAVDPDWQGALPYTVLINAAGKIIYSHQGRVDPQELKKRIVAVLGRYF